VPAKAGHSLNVKVRPTPLSTEKTTQPDVIQTMDSYYAEEGFDGDANDLAELFITAAGAATKERRSAETQGLRHVTQADLPLSFLPHSNVPAATEQPVPDPVPTPVVIVDELGPFTPRQLYRAPRVGKVYGGKDMISEDLLDATNPDHDPSDKSDSLKMPEGFGYLSASDPNFQGVLEFVMPRRLQAKRSMLRNGSGGNEEEESAVPIRSLGESEMPQEGHPLDPSRDEAAREILKNLPPGEQPSLMNGKELAKDIPADVLTRDDFSSGTRNVRRNDPPEEAAVVGEKRSGGKSTSPLGQQSTFDKSMQGTPFTTVVQEDPDVEPILYAPMNGRADHIRDQAPENWTIHDRQKYHQIELQALLGGPIPADIQSVVRELGIQSRDGWSRAVIRQVFRPVPRLGFHSAIFKRKRLLGRTSYPTFLDMGPSNPESLELQSLQMARISVAQRDLHFGNLLARPRQVLIRTPAHYRLLGARIVVLLQDISELPLLPVCSRPETETLGEATRLEVEYGLALIGYMLEVACGFYNNTISLEGKTNKTAILFVEFWWWLHRKADYLLRTDLGKRESYPRVPGSSLVSFRRILRDANDWSGRLLFNHLAYAAMRCTDQVFITLGQLLSSDRIGTRESLQQIAQHKEASLVQQGPARDAFVEAVS
jgi:hypothetical protein